MKLIALLLASVEASKISLKAATKAKVEQYGSDWSTMFGDMDMQAWADQGIITQDDLTDWNNAFSDLDSAMNDLNNWDSSMTTGGYAWDQIATDATSGQCNNTDNGAKNWYDEDCSDYEAYPSWCGSWDGNGFVSNDMCCICGGGDTATTLALHWEPEQFEGPAAGTCVNTDNGAVNNWNEDCTDYDANEHWCGSYDGNGFFSSEMCCICGGGETVTATIEPEPEQECFWWNE